MADHYIYLPVYDMELVGVAQKWKKGADEKWNGQKTYQVIERPQTGLSKWYARKKHGGVLKNVPPTATVYVLAHGYSEGRNIAGPEAEARSTLSHYGGIYNWLQKKYPLACAACEKQGYADPKKGDKALEDALEDEDAYDEIVKIFAAEMKGGKTTISLERPGAMRIGGTRPNGKTKLYSAAQFFNHLKKEELPQVPKLKIFACNTGITPKNETRSFAEQLYEDMKTAYPHTKVYGYLGAVNASYGPQSVPKNGKIPDKASELWGEFHKTSGGGYTEDRHKGARVLKQHTREVIMWGSSNQEDVPAHVLRVEFPGGKSVTGDMLVQEDGSKPF
jgi:hypothetical protein